MNNFLLTTHASVEFQGDTYGIHCGQKCGTQAHHRSTSSLVSFSDQPCGVCRPNRPARTSLVTVHTATVFFVV